MKTLSSILITLALLLNATPFAGAAIRMVTSLNDSGPGSLRDTLGGAVTGDTIDATGITGTILLTSGELPVNTSVTILGPGPNNLAVDGNASSRVFHIGPSNVVSISGLTITNGFDYIGSGIYVDSGIGGSNATLEISDCRLIGNNGGDGSGIYNTGGALSVNDCIITGNSGGFGAGIANEGTAKIVNSTLTGNSGNTGAGGGGIWNSGTLAVTNSIVSSNSVGIFYGGFFGGGGLQNLGQAIVVNSTFRGNSATAYPTYGFNLIGGGGINNSGTMNVINSTIRDNKSTGSGEDVDYFVEGIGGGIFNGGTMTISGTTIITNSATDGGGNIYNGGDFNVVTLTLVNSTLALSDSYNDSFAYSNSLILLNCTCWHEVLDDSSVANSRVYVGSTILDSTRLLSFSRTIISLGYNLSSEDGGGFLNQPTDLTNTDPMLGPLQDNGGPTLTYALLCGSPAIDKGWNFTASVTDQRGLGFTRNFDDPAVANALLADGTDIGAFERQTICYKPPGARCRNVTVSAGSDCTANASIDNASFAPDGNPITLTQTPPGPYPLGTNLVTLKVTDNNGVSDSCSATVTVMDTTPPNMTCPDNISTNISWCQTSVVVNYLPPSASDNCGGVTVNCAPPSGSIFPPGITTVTCTATDTSGNTNTCSFTITVNRPDSGDGPVTSFTVVNRNDSGAGSLRQAILDANASAGLDTIEFAPSAYGTILLTSGDLPITDCLIINGPGITNLTVDGNAASRVFYIGPNTVVSISGLTISHGTTSSDVECDCGAGIFNYGMLSISNVTLSGNTSEVGGGIYNLGGHIYYAGGLTIADSTLSSNSGGIFGGGIYNGGALAIVRSTLSENTLSENIGSTGGGGIFNGGTLTIANSILRGNSTPLGWGGGIVNDQGGTVTVASSTLSLNAANAGDDIANGAGNFGGGTVTIFNSTLSGNSANGGGVVANTAFGSDPATMTIVNSTLNGMHGCIYNDGLFGRASVEIGSTILNVGSPGDDTIFNRVPGTVTSLGYNLSSDDGGGFLTNATDQINTDPLLGPLQDNGGPTFTHALLCGSPAIDAGKNFLSLATDQRGVGFTRTFDDPSVPNAPGGDGTDIGASEIQQACAPLDSDGDGVPDTIDECPDTMPGEIVDATGCSIAQLVPCDGPRSGGTWKNHGQYVSAVNQTATDFLKTGLITRRQWDQIITGAAHSRCGSAH